MTKITALSSGVYSFQIEIEGIEYTGVCSEVAIIAAGQVLNPIVEEKIMKTVKEWV